jgi:hypothetical protein
MRSETAQRQRDAKEQRWKPARKIRRMSEKRKNRDRLKDEKFCRYGGPPAAVFKPEGQHRSNAARKDAQSTFLKFCVLFVAQHGGHQNISSPDRHCGFANNSSRSLKHTALQCLGDSLPKR